MSTSNQQVNEQSKIEEGSVSRTTTPRMDIKVQKYDVATLDTDDWQEAEMFQKFDEEDPKKGGNQNTPTKKIVVLGSLNYDVFLQMKRLPQVGETLEASDDIFKAFGGKGSN